MKEEVFQKLEIIAQQLGVGIDTMWNALIMQAFYWSTAVSCFLGVILVGLVIGLIIFAKRYKNNTWEGKEILEIPLFVLGIGILMWISVIAVILPDILVGFFNPEYWALSEISNLLKCK